MFLFSVGIYFMLFVLTFLLLQLFRMLFGMLYCPMLLVAVSWSTMCIFLMHTVLFSYSSHNFVFFFFVSTVYISSNQFFHCFSDLFTYYLLHVFTLVQLSTQHVRQFIHCRRCILDVLNKKHSY